MSEGFDRILDECVDRINRGESLADCLSQYPAYADRLRPMLQSMQAVRKTYAFTPSPDAKRAARQRFHTTLDRQRQVTPALSFLRLISRPAVVVTVAVLVVAFVATLVILPRVVPETLVPNTEGNFAFLISDEPNAIGDFESLNVTISRVVLRAAGSVKPLEFTPETKTVDLTQLQGEDYQEIWRGDVPAGQYSHVVIYVSEVIGELESTGISISVKLPSSRLQMSVSFEVTTDTVTSFTFDITVVKTGKSGKYNLKPQIGESGARPLE
jgi:hypothetical protein